MSRINLLCAILCLFALLVGCGGGGVAPNPDLDSLIDLDLPQRANIQFAQGFPDSVPQDVLQPWEQLDENGMVLINSHRGVAATRPSTEFYEGPQTHLESGDTSDWNGALRIASGTDGEGKLSFAMYRIPLGGSQPGVVCVDANLRPMGDGKIGGYYVGLADYGNGSWQWFGPVTDAHWRISAVQAAREATRYTSNLGNVFVCVAAHNGTALDIVGIGIDPLNPADVEPPPVPSDPSLTPVAGGLLVDWTAFAGGDIAGYKVYFADHAFTELTAFSAETLPTLHDSLLRLDLTENSSNTWWVALSTVDFSGNESAISSVVTATPFPSEPGQPPVWIELDSATALINRPIGMVAAGANSYDWDLNGDGAFDVLGDTSGIQTMDTSQTGLIRPLVKGTGADTASVALSAVSVIVSSNARPVAVANVTPANGNAPLGVTFSGTDSTDFDGSIVGGGWDFDGDGIYDVWDSTDIVHVTSTNHTYTSPGLYNAKLRVVDDDGAWDVDGVTVFVTPTEPENQAPVARLEINPSYGDDGDSFTFDATNSYDLDGTIVLYEWDFDGDGTYDASGSNPTKAQVMADPGVFTSRVRVTDNSSATSTASASAEIRVNEVFDLDHPWPSRGRDNRHTGRSPYAGSQLNVVKWSFYCGPGLYSSPAIGSDGAVYVGNLENKLYSINEDGTERWTFHIGDAVVSSPAIGADGSVYVGCMDANFYAINSDGTENWSYPTGAEILSSPTISADGTLYFGSGDTRLYALNPDGSISWFFSTGGPITSSPAVASDGTIYIGSLDYKLYAVNADGSLKWSYTTDQAVHSSPSIGPDGTVYVGSQDSKLYAVSEHGNLNWSFTTGGPVQSSPAIAADGTVYAGSWDGKLYAINSDGSLKWSFITGDDVTSSPTIGVDGTIYVGSRDEKIYAINPDGSLKWSYATGGSIECSGAIGEDGTLYFGSQDGLLYAFSPPPGGEPPTASLTADPPYGDEGVTITFDASGSSDPGGHIVLYEFDFDGDGFYDASSDETDVATHTYNNHGVFTVRLRITDNDGERNTATAEVRVNEVFNLDHPWPARGRDNRHTGRSPYVGPQTNNSLWSYTLGDKVYSSPAISTDGTVYLGCNDDKLYALNPDGSLKWSYTTGGYVMSTPAIGVDGTVYFGSLDYKLYALNSDGTLSWSYTTGDDIRSSPAIGPDGKVYIGSGDYKLYAINPDGTLSWSCTTGGDIRSSPAIGIDGWIFVGSSNGDLNAIDQDGSLQWSVDTGGSVYSSPAIGPDGTVYVGSSVKLLAFNRDGSQKWFYSAGNTIISSPAIGPDGTIYVGCYDDKLYAINPDGTEEWFYTTGGDVISSPSIGADGVVYVGSYDNNIYAINPNGSLLWSFATGLSIESSPAIGTGGKVYIGSWDHKLYAFGP